MSSHHELDAIRATKESWETENAQQFEKERKKRFESEGGIPYKRIYTPLDLEEKGFSYMKDLGFPGEYPYTRNRSCSGRLRGGFPQISDPMSFGTPDLPFSSTDGGCPSVQLLQA